MGNPIAWPGRTYSGSCGFRLVLAAVFIGALLVAPAAQAYVTYNGTDAGPAAGMITLKRGDGSNVTKVVHGLRTFVIRDRSAIHNFHLLGPGVDRRTTVAFVGTKTWTPVLLRVGTYVFKCDAHPRTMRKTFVVT